MGVYIKGLQMPKNCMECPFKGFDRAKGRGNICTIDETITLHAVLDGLDVKFVNVGDCPLVPIPDHGDLIDRDALMARYAEEVKPSNNSDFMRPPRWNDAVGLTELAAVVIPAERSEDADC